MLNLCGYRLGELHLFFKVLLHLDKEEDGGADKEDDDDDDSGNAVALRQYCRKPLVLSRGQRFLIFASNR